jgi:two-component system chemotaxis response regulator CheB
MMTNINADETVRDVIVIGGSLGSAKAINTLLALLPAGLPAFVGVVVHRHASSQTDWSSHLGVDVALPILQPSRSMPLERGVVYVAPADQHMTFSRTHVRLDRDTKREYARPSVNSLFSSAAVAFGSRVVAVVMTGKGRDGTQGAIDVVGQGGMTLVQSRAEALQTGMPSHALAQDHVSAELGLHGLATVLQLVVRGQSSLVEPA